MEIRGAEQEVLCGSAGDTHSTGKHERQQARNDESKPDSSEPAVPGHVFSFLATVTHLVYAYVVRWEAVSEGQQNHHL